MVPPMTTSDVSQYPPTPFPPGYPMMNPYAYIPPHQSNMNEFQQTQFTPEMIEAYTKYHQMNAQSFSQVPTTSASPEGGTVSPTEQKSLLSPQDAAISPNYSMQPSTSQLTPVSHNGTPQPSEVSNPYTVNQLLSSSTQNSPGEEGNEEKENKSVRRNTLPTVNRKRRSNRPEGPEIQRIPPAIPPNFTANYTPMMMQNLAALMDPYYHRRDICQICGDNATGFHYGVMSCEGCKGFFRRSVQKKSEYICAKGSACMFSYENCSANRGIRTRCQACRYKRCIEMGMKRDHIKIGTDKIIKEEVSSTSEEIPKEIRELFDSFASSMPITTRFDSNRNAVEAIRNFIRSTPQMASLFPKEQFDSIIEGISKGILIIRAAFTFDPIPFCSDNNEQFNATVNNLRNGVRNTVMNERHVALLSSIFILQMINGCSTNIFPIYCQALRTELTRTHPHEVGIYERIICKLGTNLI